MHKELDEDGIDIGGALASFFGTDEDPNEDGQTEAEAKEHKKSVKGLRTTQKHFERRVLSELALEKELPWHFEKGSTYHVISFGDVDSLTYLRTIVKQQRIKYALLSTWCMAITDAEEVKKWLDAGYIERVDFYVGEIFEKSYSGVYNFIIENCLRHGGRIAVFRNHSKVIAGFGERFDFAIASSANINTNPRCENTTITIDTEVANFYKTFFDDIKGFNKGFRDWTPYNERRDDNAVREEKTGRTQGRRIQPSRRFKAGLPGV